ncbi:transcriptional regulatory [Fusarium denticulatum]|uniref:Transcriptional regulatory n=1 Tax=Fusarium denticulatum TaxID=48507 RepID=A0A8H5XA42_9HYPO|nr:transcriptional regulatory [Fusarium denticulatum]
MQCLTNILRDSSESVYTTGCSATFSLGIGCAKSSFAVLYLRINPQPVLRILNKCLLVFLAMQAIEEALIVIFQCRPVMAAYVVPRPAHAKCLDLRVLWWCTFVFNMCTDLFLFIQPIPAMWRLHLPVAKRLGLIAMLSLGLLVCVTSIIRITFVTRIGPDATCHSKGPLAQPCLELSSGRRSSNNYYGWSGCKKTGGSIALKSYGQNHKDGYLQSKSKGTAAYGLTSHAIGGAHTKNDSTEEIFPHKTDGNGAILVTHEMTRDVELHNSSAEPSIAHVDDCEIGFPRGSKPLINISFSTLRGKYSTFNLQLDIIHSDYQIPKWNRELLMNGRIGLIFGRPVFHAENASPAASLRHLLAAVSCAGHTAQIASFPRSLAQVLKLLGVGDKKGCRQLEIPRVSVVESALNSVPNSSSRNTTSHENQASNVSPTAPKSTELTQQNAQSEESPLALGSNDEQPHNLHIVGPAVTSDNQVLSDYLSSMPSASRGSRIIRPAIGNRSRPVLFTAVQKRPVGLDSNLTFAEERLQLIEKILEPFTSDLVDVYFHKANSCFPLLDEAHFRKQYRENKSAISPALLSGLYAHSITFWNSSPVLSRHRCPDGRFIWNLATEAAYSQIHRSPGISTIEALILNIGGREVTALIGNGVLLASSVSMAHSLGLNHSPISWEIPQSEKNLRMKIWWALLIHDKWLSLSHGTPPLISPTLNDVPQPLVEHLCGEGNSSEQVLNASVYIALVGLTEVLDLHLRHVHQFSLSDESTDTTHLELALNNWIETLSDEIRRVVIRGNNLTIPGAANLRLSYLTVRLLLQRIELEAEKRVRDTGDSRLLNRYMQARRTAEDILILTQELQPEHLADCWLPSSAFAFSTTVSFLLRCALETENSTAGLVQSSSLKIASELLSALSEHKEKSAWDLGDICLAQHADVVEKLRAMTPPGDSSAEEVLDFSSFAMAESSYLDQLFPSLWDPLQNVW